MSSESSEMRRGSPLVEFIAEHPPTDSDPSRGVEMSERAFWGHINLRGDGSDEAFQAGVEQVIGARAPIEPNTVSRVGEAAIAWLGPDEWLVISSPDIKDGLSAKLEEALAGLHASVNDISGGQTIIRLRGARARDLLNKGCPLGPASSGVRGRAVRPEPHSQVQRPYHSSRRYTDLRCHSAAKLR